MCSPKWNVSISTSSQKHTTITLKIHKSVFINLALSNVMVSFKEKQKTSNFPATRSGFLTPGRRQISFRSVYEAVREKLC